MRCEMMDLRTLGGGNEARGGQICAIIFRDGGGGGCCCCGSVGGDIDILINGGGAVVVVVWSTPPAWKSHKEHHLEPQLPVTQKQSSVVRGYAHHFMLTPAITGMSGMIGHLFILKSKTVKDVLSKLTTHREYWVMCLLKENKKLQYSVQQNQLVGTQFKENSLYRSSWEQTSIFLLLQFQSMLLFIPYV